jgi:hypothetical protein
MGDISYDTNALEEWKEARTKINELDNNLHDLRKYGLTFVAALLATNTILEYTKLNNLTKFSISIITISFITVLNLIDQYYQDITAAVSERARVLETVILNMELDEMISYQFTHGHLPAYIKWTYNGLVIIAVAVGVALIISVPSTSSTNVGNFSILPSTSVDLNSLSNILVTILKFLLMSILLSIFLLGPLVVIKNINDRSELWSKLRDSTKECLKSFIRLFEMFFVAIYYTLFLFYFYSVLIHLFSFEITLSFLLIFIGCIGMYIIDFSGEIIRRRRAYQKKSKKLGTNSETIKDNCDPEDLKNTKLDWIIDRLSCKQDEVVRITVTNLGKNNVLFKSKMSVCKITSDDGSFEEDIYADKDIIVPSHENHSWLWHTGKTAEGMYRIKPCGWEVPIRRSIFIHCQSKTP